MRRSRSPGDGRRQVIGLTQAGRAVFGKLDALSSEQIRGLLAPIPAGRRSPADRGDGRHQGDPRRTAGGRHRRCSRPPVPGDLGWVVQRNGALYAAEYGWDETYEALVARIVADYAARADRTGEAAWIAEAGGERAGCVFCMRKSEQTAQLRLLLVEPSARGMGIGARLVAECLAFARRAGYREIVLWTNDVLHAARRIYQRAGFELAGLAAAPQLRPRPGRPGLAAGAALTAAGAGRSPGQVTPVACRAPRCRSRRPGSPPAPGRAGRAWPAGCRRGS